jgi:hypothetical protein
MMNSFFNPSILGAAKDAGIAVSVLIGVLAIFGVIAAIKGRIEGWRFFTIAGFGALTVLCLMFVFWISTREIYHWIDTKALADWGGNDEGWTDGREPAAMYCDRSREGTLAVCWSNRPEGYPSSPPPMFHGTQGNGAWCTFKLKEKLVFGAADGASRGRVYVCGRVSL